MTRGALRVALASGLVAVTLVVPSVAWYVAGHREVEREAARLEQAPRQLAAETARRFAARLADRLESLRERESRRPYYHYQRYYHDPEGASQGASVVPSPLALGRADELIRSYFQVDDRGRLATLASQAEASGAALAGRAAGPSGPRDPLRAAIPIALALLEADRAPSPQGRTVADRGGRESKTSPAKSTVQVLDPSAYVQNQQAVQLFTDLRRSQGAVPTQSVPPLARAARGAVSIEIGPLEGHTVSLGDAPTLAALRIVRTPDARLVQGFVVDTAEVLRDLASPVPARFAPGDSSEGAAIAAVGSTGWSVAVEPTAALAAAVAESAALRARFARTFVGGLLAAALAGVCVIGLVWQSERLARQRSQFAAASAHELRTPLAGLRLHGEMLAEGLGDPARAQGYARAIAAEAERLGRVVANVLEFTRLERGMFRVSREPGDLAATVREGAVSQTPALEASGARVVLALEDGLPDVRFDADAVRHMLQNLLDNAERHTREAADRTIELTLARGGEGVALSVADRGPGIPAASRRRLFRAFPGARDGHVSAGLGIGLALVRALAREHGGAVAYRPRDGGGAIFTVTFPAEA